MDTTKLPTPYNAIRLAEQGKFAEAIDLARKIPWAHWRGVTFKEIAAIAGKKNLSIARQALDLCASTLNELDGDYWRAIFLRDMGSVKVSLGLVDDALKDFDSAVEYVDKIEDTSVKAGAMREVASEIAKHKDVDSRISQKAKQAFQRAAVHAELVDDVAASSGHLVEIAHEMGKAGFTNEALSLFVRATALAKRIEDRNTRLAQMREVIAKMHKAGLGSDAQIVVDEALSEARKIDDEWERSKALSEIVETLSKAAVGDAANRDTLLAKAQTVAQQITEKWWRSKTYTDIALAEIQIGDTTAAQDLLSRIEFPEMVGQVQEQLATTPQENLQPQPGQIESL